MTLIVNQPPLSDKKMSIPEDARGLGLPAVAAAELLAWYRRHRRDLPWRRTRDPYAIWVSEVMLQQTQVVKVEPFYRAFMERYPTLEDLAEAPIDEVLAQWSGLGYYRRARLLHRAARELVDCGRRLPRTAAELEALPGIGPYTAAAIASIAFDEAVPVLDGNVERVICRLLAVEADPKRPKVRRRLLRELLALIDLSAPGDSNQALMELGATVCRPRSPACLVCPLAHRCLGRGTPEAFPPPRARRQNEAVTHHLALVRRGEAILLFRRPQGAELFAGMWELPSIETPGEAIGLERLESLLAERYGGSWRLGDPLARLAHGITYRSITALVHPAEVETLSTVAEGPEAAWVRRSELSGYAVSSLVAKALERVAVA